MAHVIYKDGKRTALSVEQGVKLWKALRSPTGLTDEQLDRLANIKAVYLNWHTAPDDYIRENLSAIIPLALNDWYVNSQGKPTKPQSDEAWRFAKKWGLWQFGRPTLLVSGGSVAAAAEPALPGGLEIYNR